MAGVVEGGACGKRLGAEGEVAGCLLGGKAAQGAAVGEDDGLFVVWLVDTEGFALVQALVLGVGEGVMESAAFGLIGGLGVGLEAVVDAYDELEDFA